MDDDPLLAMEEGEATAATSEWRSIENPGRFMRFVYQHHRARGYRGVILSRVADLLSVLFVAVVMFLLLGGALSGPEMRGRIHSPECPDGTENAATLFERDCLGHRPVDAARVRSANWFLILIMAVFTAGWLVCLTGFAQDLKHIRSIDRFYREALDLSPQQQRTCAWETVLARMVAAQREHRMFGNQRLDLLHLVGLLTRRDNYHVALYGERIIDPGVSLGPILGRRPTLPWSLHAMLDFALDWSVFDGAGNRSDTFLREEPAQRAVRLARTYRRLGLIALPGSPFLLVYRAAHYVFRFADEFRRSPSLLAARQWTPLARWRFREYSEEPHVLDARLRRAHGPARDYLAGFPAELSPPVARLTCLVVGGVVSLLLIGGLVYDEEFFLADLSPGRSVGWWFTVLGAVTVASRSFLTASDRDETPAQSLRRVSNHTHHEPAIWRDQPLSGETHASFVQQFAYRLAVVAEELLGCLTTPYILFFHMPRQAARVVDFIDRNTATVAGLGDVCSLSLMQTEQSDEYLTSSLYGDQVSVTKMQASLASFRAQHPQWHR